MIDSRDFLAAKTPRRQPRCCCRPDRRSPLTGGLDFNDHRLIWDRLDKVHAKHPDMVLLHGGSPKGAELIAAKWATNRKVPQIAFKPDWTKHAKAAPFKRNDAMLEVLPIGVMVFPGTGIQDNLADKARKLGIPVWRFGERRRVSAAYQPQKICLRPGLGLTINTPLAECQLRFAGPPDRPYVAGLVRTWALPPRKQAP